MPERGWVWPLAAEKTQEALRSGALVPIPTHSETIADGECSFLVRTIGDYAKKETLGKPALASAPDPFLPPDPALVVAELGATHRAVLNKFQVVPDHLLLVTRQFEPQESPLTPGDFSAAWACLGGADALVFYNSGRLAGASQPHKHLQAVRLPLGASADRVPMEPMLEPVVFDGQVSRALRLPFVNGLARLDPNWVHEEAVRTTCDLYQEILGALHLLRRGEQGLEVMPHNLIMTREWLFVVPRSREGCGPISINGLGYAGALLVRDHSEREQLIAMGPMKALTMASVSRPVRAE